MVAMGMRIGRISHFVLMLTQYSYMIRWVPAFWLKRPEISAVNWGPRSERIE